MRELVKLFFSCYSSCPIKRAASDKNSDVNDMKKITNLRHGLSGKSICFMLSRQGTFKCRIEINVRFSSLLYDPDNLVLWPVRGFVTIC